MPITAREAEQPRLKDGELKPGEIYAWFKHDDFEGLIVTPDTSEEVVLDGQIVTGFTLAGTPVPASTHNAFIPVQAELTYKML